VQHRGKMKKFVLFKIMDVTGWMLIEYGEYNLLDKLWNDPIMAIYQWAGSKYYEETNNT
jgi:hypothetical protein